MQFTVYGEHRSLDPSATRLDQVIQQLGHRPRPVLVEYNGLILTPEFWEAQQVQDGDNLEIVTIVGGGS